MNKYSWKEKSYGFVNLTYLLEVVCNSELFLWIKLPGELNYFIFFYKEH